MSVPQREGREDRRATAGPRVGPDAPTALIYGAKCAHSRATFGHRDRLAEVAACGTVMNWDHLLITARKRE